MDCFPVLPAVGPCLGTLLISWGGSTKATSKPISRMLQGSCEDAVAAQEPVKAALDCGEPHVQKLLGVQCKRTNNTIFTWRTPKKCFFSFGFPFSNAKKGHQLQKHTPRWHYPLSCPGGVERRLSNIYFDPTLQTATMCGKAGNWLQAEPQERG